MKLLSLSLVLSALSLMATAQTIPTSGRINVNGTANKKVLPDVASFNFNVSVNMKTEAECLAKLTENSKELAKKLKALGYKETDIKLTEYNINKEFIYESDKPKSIVYYGRQSFLLKFKLNKDNIVKVFEQFKDESSSNTSVNYNSTCSDTLIKRVEKELIVAALADAKTLANIIAQNTNTDIKGIAEINYNVANRRESLGDMSVSNFNYAAREGAAEPFTGFSINEIGFSKEIFVAYNILNK